MRRDLTRASRTWATRARRALTQRLGDERGMAIVLVLALMLALAMITSMFVLTMSAAHHSADAAGAPVAARAMPTHVSAGVPGQRLTG